VALGVWEFRVFLDPRNLIRRTSYL